jgi:nucleoid-associated protein YgaU
MPTVDVALLAATTSTRRKVTISSEAGVTTVPIMSPAASLGGLAAKREEEERPGRKPINAPAGGQLATETLTMTLVNLARPGGTVEHLIAELIAHARAPWVVVAYGPLEASSRVVPAGAWTIDDLQVTTVEREEGTNAITEAAVTMALKERSEPATPSSPGTSTPPSGASPLSASGFPARRATPAAGGATSTSSYTVREGDTLWSIAAAVYGDGSWWARLGDANGIRDPRHLVAGTRLTIP